MSVYAATNCDENTSWVSASASKASTASSNVRGNRDDPGGADFQSYVMSSIGSPGSRCSRIPSRPAASMNAAAR